MLGLGPRSAPAYLIVNALALGYGAQVAVDALTARVRILRGEPAGTIAGVTAATWFLTNAGFAQEVGADRWGSVAEMSLLFITLIGASALWTKMDSFTQLRANVMGADEMP